jgi:hypothetical protein
MSTNIAKSRVVKAAGGIGLALAACAACCAPLIAPWLVAVVAASGAGLVLAGQVGLALAITGGAAFYVWRVSRRRSATHATLATVTSSSCGCAPSEGDKAC